MAKSKSNSPAGWSKIAQRNPFCFDGNDHLALSQTIGNVQDGLRFLGEMEPPDGLSEGAEIGRVAFLDTLRCALEYAQTQRHQLEQRDRAKAPEVAND
jgi:hypothetical protein